MIVAAVPIKDLSDAKQRLASVLTLAERDQLARAMLRDVLRALAAAELDRVWVVTRDPAVAAMARGLGAEPLVEAENRGHTAAVALAQAEAARRGARVFLTIPGDVPCVTADELRQVVDGVRDGAPIFVPSRSGLGTNGVALAPPPVLALAGLGLDLDAPEVLTALLAERRDTETRRLIASWRQRLASTHASRDEAR